MYGRLSSILAEQSYGYLKLGLPHKTLSMRTALAAQAQADRDNRLETWLPLDWARGHLKLGDVEASVQEGLIFLHRAVAMHSPHAQRQVYSFLQELEQRGYASLAIVRDFRAEAGSLVRQRV